MQRKVMKYKYKHPTERVLIFIIVAIIALLAAILWVFGQKIDILWNEHQTQAAKPVPAEFSQMIQGAQRALYNPGDVDAVAKRVYFPGLDIYVPLTQKSQTFMYSQPLEDSGTNEATFSANSIINSPMNDFSEVSCIARPAGVSVGKPNSAWNKSQQAGTVSLSDGRTLYLYKSSAGNCRNIYAYISPDDIVNSLKQAKSY
jgi:hypothetical protein